MTGLNVLTATPRRGVLRLVVLVLTLVGFAALHAFGSVAGDGAHCGSALTLTVVTDPQTTAATPSSDHHAGVVMAHDEGARADATTPDHDPDDATTGCLLALFGALVLIGLRLLRRLGTDNAPVQLRHASARLCAARAPPGPLFLSLCVFRL